MGQHCSSLWIESAIALSDGSIQHGLWIANRQRHKALRCSGGQGLAGVAQGGDFLGAQGAVEKFEPAEAPFELPGIISALIGRRTVLTGADEHGLSYFCEVKTVDGRLSKAQEEFRDLCRERRWPWAVVRDVTEFDRQLDAWGIRKRGRLA